MRAPSDPFIQSNPPQFGWLMPKQIENFVLDVKPLGLGIGCTSSLPHTKQTGRLRSFMTVSNTRKPSRRANAFPASFSTNSWIVILNRVPQNFGCKFFARSNTSWSGNLSIATRSLQCAQTPICRSIGKNIFLCRHWKSPTVTKEVPPKEQDAHSIEKNVVDMFNSHY